MKSEGNPTDSLKAKSDPISAMLKYLPAEVTIAIPPRGPYSEIEYKEFRVPTRDIIIAFMKLKEMAIEEVCRIEAKERKSNAINAIVNMSYFKCSPTR